MTLNSTISYAGIRYEVYWSSLYADHILANFSLLTHGVKFTEIITLLNTAGFVEATKRAGVYVFITDSAGTIFETYAYLTPDTAARPAYCVVVTSYKSSRLKSKLTASVVAS